MKAFIILAALACVGSAYDVQTYGEMSPREDFECLVCEKIVKDVKEFLLDQEIQNATIAFLKEDVCERLPVMKKACHDFASTELIKLMEYVAKDVIPKNVCSQMVERKCPGEYGMSTVKVDGGIECYACKMAVSAAISFLTGNIDRVKALLKYICKVLPDAQKATCLADIDEYAEAIMDALKKMVNPTMICELIGMC